MRHKIKGIVLQKTPFKEKGIIAQILMFNGKKIAAIFFSGRGANRRGDSILELGHCLSFTLADHKRGTETLYQAREWTLLWAHQKIRHHYQGFLLMSFALEVCCKVALSDDLREEEAEDQQGAGLFRILSNALFYLDKTLHSEVSSVQLIGQRVLFLCKMCFELGIRPLLYQCALCDSMLCNENVGGFVIAKNGFFCLSCQHVESAHQESQKLWNTIICAWSLKYEDLSNFPTQSPWGLEQIFHYFCVQNHLVPSSFRSLTFGRT